MAGSGWRKEWDLTEGSVQIFHFILTLKTNGNSASITQYSIQANVQPLLSHVLLMV